MALGQAMTLTAAVWLFILSVGVTLARNAELAWITGILALLNAVLFTGSIFRDIRRFKKVEK